MNEREEIIYATARSGDSLRALYNLCGLCGCATEVGMPGRPPAPQAEYPVKHEAFEFPKMNRAHRRAAMRGRR